MQYLLKPFHWLYCIYAIIVFVVVMLLLFPFAIIATFFGAIKGGNLVYRVCMLWGDTWFFLVGIRHRNYFEQPEDKARQYIFVANHISYLDAALLVKSIRRSVRALGKIEMAKVPVFGFIYRNAIVTVDRSSIEARAKSVRRLKAVLRSNISIVVFPEGTFNMTPKPLQEFYDGAFRIAIETQTPIKPVLFLDGYDRMHYRHLFTLTPGKSRAIHLEEIPVEGLTLNDIAQLKQRVFDIMEAKLRAYKVSWINDLHPPSPMPI